MKYILRILLSFITVIFLFVLGCVIFFAVDNNASIMGYSIFTASGHSMTPTINEGDILLVSKEHAYRKGDIIVYKNDEGLKVCHRVIDKDGVSYITKGDSNNYTDGYNPIVEDIYGKVIFNVINTEQAVKYKYPIIVALIIVPIILTIINRSLHVRRDNN